MRPFNRTLTLVAVAVLVVTISILFWMRNRSATILRTIVETTVTAFDHAALLNEPTDSRASFDAAEAFVAGQKSNPYIRDLVVTKRFIGPGTNDAAEVPIVPYYLHALRGEGWLDQLATMEKRPLQTGGDTYGYLYFDLDRTALRSVDLAIVAASIALVITLIALLGRLYSQDTSLKRVGGELEERKRELIRLERLALAGQLSANLLHDLKKPVSHIWHSMEDLRSALGDYAGASAALADIQQQTNLFFQMLQENQIERFVRSDRVQEEYVDLNEILELSLRLVHYERGGVAVETDFASDLAPVLAQPFRLIQVFSNLILNAYQAMGGRGTLHLKTAAADRGVVARIRDDGPGIPVEYLNKIFDPFFTTKAEAEGSGLGLAISRLIVEELKGKIAVESREGGPTTFSVWLPGENPPADGEAR
jgi:signal transduction histidine kinase